MHELTPPDQGPNSHSNHLKEGVDRPQAWRAGLEAIGAEHEA